MHMTCGEADGIGVSQPGEGQAKGGPHRCLQLPNRRVKGRWRCTVEGQEAMDASWNMGNPN